jgi:hypothetical protein
MKAGFPEISQTALHPLIHEKNEEVRVTTIGSIEKSLESGKNPVMGKFLL